MRTLYLVGSSSLNNLNTMFTVRHDQGVRTLHNYIISIQVTFFYRDVKMLMSQILVIYANR